MLYDSSININVDYITMVRTCNEPYPANCEYEEIFAGYPFALSDFQKYAIEAIEKDKHILVTAHTGSGKTLPAEYAIQKFHKKLMKLKKS